MSPIISFISMSLFIYVIVGGPVTLYGNILARKEKDQGTSFVYQYDYSESKQTRNPHAAISHVMQQSLIFWC